MADRNFLTDRPIPVETLEEDIRQRGGQKAVVTLQGVIRRDKEGQEELDRVVYEADRIRVEDEVLSIQREVNDRWRGELVFRLRLGAVRVGETSVFIAVTSAKRADALTACHHVMEKFRHMPGMRKSDVFRDGIPRITQSSHEAILLSDDAFSLPQS